MNKTADGKGLHQKTGGQRGIRTLETVTRLHAFQACAFDHSATSPASGTGVGDGECAGELPAARQTADGHRERPRRFARSEGAEITSKRALTQGLYPKQTSLRSDRPKSGTHAAIDMPATRLRRTASAALISG